MHLTALTWVKNEFRTGWGTLLHNLIHRKTGETLVEYVMIIALVSVLLIVALNALGAAIVNIPIGNIVAVL